MPLSVFVRLGQVSFAVIDSSPSRIASKSSLPRMRDSRAGTVSAETIRGPEEARRDEDMVFPTVEGAEV